MQIERIADSRVNAIWETVCYLGCGGELFTTKSVEQFLVKHDSFKPKTAQLYFNRFAQYAMNNPEQFSGPKSKLVRVSKGKWRLDDNPER